ncbi:hypothetical protein AU194_16050 [Mycobacterium sp. GA-2829]|nr:hypothetical protein AU194_16050 [Mycobacterium sp. GA-2829]
MTLREDCGSCAGADLFSAGAGAGDDLRNLTHQRAQCQRSADTTAGSRFEAFNFLIGLQVDGIQT